MSHDEEEALAHAIQNLSHKKKHVISEDALKAKDAFDQQQEDLHLGNNGKWWQKRLALVEEFTESVRLLTAVFQASAFDELALFISSPSRILLVNFLIGILRGIGFAMGFLFVVVIVAYMIKQSLPHDYAKHALYIIAYMFRQMGMH